MPTSCLQLCETKIKVPLAHFCEEERAFSRNSLECSSLTLMGSDAVGDGLVPYPETSLCT